MKANVKQKIRILFILWVSCSFVFTTGCSGLRHWWGYDAPASQMRGDNYTFANSDLNQFYASVRPVDGNVESDYQLARYFQKRGKHKFAVDELLKAIRKDPSFIKAYNALGVSYDHLNQYDLAVKSYTFALQLNPELDYVHNNLGYSYLLRGDLDAAIDAFRKALVLDNTNKRYHNNLGLAYARKGQPDMAYDEFKLAENQTTDQHKITQASRNLKPEFNASKETTVDTSPEGITPYDNIQKIKETPPLLAVKDQNVSARIFENELIPNDFDETDLLEKSVKNEVKNSNLDSSKENKVETEDRVNYTLQVAASSNLRDASLLMEELLKKGYPCPYLNKVGNENPFYRVRLGNFNNKKEADQWISDLTHTLGYEPFLANEDKQAEKIISGKQNDLKTKTIASTVAQKLNIEISNGNGVRHMARNMGTYLNHKGFIAYWLTNADHFNYPKTKIYYQKGYQEEALRLAKEIPCRQNVPSVIEQNQMMKRAIKVLIGKDLVPFHEYIRSDLKIIPSVKTG